MFRVGDTVALTGATLMAISRQHPDIFSQLQGTSRTGGEVLEIHEEPTEEGYQRVVIDMGEALDKPLMLEVDHLQPQLSVQLIKRAGSGQLEAVPEPPAFQPSMPSMPTGPDGPPEGAFQMYQLGPDGQPIGMTGGQMPPHIVEAIRNMAHGDASAVGNHMQPSQLRPVPREVQLSQWVMTQFINLKQYVIVQDLNRDDDEPERERVAPGEEWKNNPADDNKSLRRIELQLAPQEELLYGAALKKLQEWIETGEAPEPPQAVLPTPEPIVVKLPEMTESPAKQYAADAEEAEEGEVGLTTAGIEEVIEHPPVTKEEPAVETHEDVPHGDDVGE